MINIKGVKNFTIHRGDTFEFAFRLNLVNLLKGVYFNCPKLNILNKKCSFYEGCFYVRLEANETLDIDPELTTVNYSIVIHTISGTVTSLFIDGVIEITEGANSDSHSVIEEYADSLSVVNEFNVDPSFSVDIFDWLRIQLPAMKRVDELPEASRETLDNFYVLNEDGTIWYTKQVDETIFEWNMVSTSNLYCHIMKFEFTDELVFGTNYSGTLYIRFYNSNKNKITNKNDAINALLKYGINGPVSGSAIGILNDNKYVWIVESISWEGIVGGYQINMRGVSEVTGYGLRKSNGIGSNMITAFNDTVVLS